MNASPWTACAAAAALSATAVGCGGSAAHPANGSATVGAQKPSVRYVVRMSGSAETPRGAASGAGVAIIALHDRAHAICWRFAHLHGFTAPTAAHIHRGTAGHAGPIAVPLSVGPRLHHRGCVSVPATVISAIAMDPGGYYVNVHSSGYPAGAVRAQL